VGFGCTRVQTLLNRRRYDAPWLYHECKKIDGIPDEDGTYLWCGLEVLRKQGHRRVIKGEDYPASPAEGISAYRWTQDANEVAAVLANPLADRYDAVELLNSWGHGYPHRVFMPLYTLQRLLDEGGEAGVVTDR
jgi:hypothetical protein